jgi:zinc protease
MKTSFRLLLAVLVLATAGATARAAVADNAVRTSIAGIDVIAYPTGVKNVVTFRGSLPAGDSLAPEHNIAVPTLVGAMLDQGTLKQDKFALAQKLESVGATLSFSVDGTMLTISGKCLAQDMPLVISLLAEQLREPAFPASELEKVKKQLAGDFQRALESTDYRANLAFSQAVYPIGHPNRDAPTEEFLAAVQSATVDDLRAFHRTYYGPAAFTLIAVGDVDPTALQAEVTKAFSGWTGGKPTPAPARARPTDAAKDQVVFIADKTNVSMIWGQATGLKYNDPDTLALRVGTNIFGSGFTGRLMANVRDREGLTYGIYSAVLNDTHTDGDWRIVANFSPELLEKGIASTQRQLTEWSTKGVSPEEFAREQSNYIGTYKVTLATTTGMANALLASVQRGYGVSWPDELPKRVAAMTVNEVNSAIKKHVRPESLVLIKSGTVPERAK